MINYQRFNVLFHEFANELEQIHALYLDSVNGFKLLHEAVHKRQQDFANVLGNCEHANAEFQDTCSISYHDLSGAEFSLISLSPNMKQGDVKNRTADNGHNLIKLGQLCIISLHSYWESYLRLEIGKAKGVIPIDATDTKEVKEILKDHVKFDVWGDICKIRNSIVHNNGIANNDIDRCKILKWFSSGDRIELDYQKMNYMFRILGIFRNSLSSMSHAPRPPLRVPSN